jgi:hypothetical protein
VDLNRNYPYQWGFDDAGSSPATGAETYRGTAPASEPETAAMVAFLAARDFRTSLSIHTFSDVWLMPYGYAPVLPDNHAEYLELAALCTEASGYAFGTVPELLYPANGGAIDLEEALHGTVAMAPEIGGEEDGFWPPTDRIVPLAEENLPGLQATALSAGAWARVLGVTPVDQGDGDGGFESGESVGLVVDVRNSGLDATAGAVTATLSISGAGATVTDGAHDFGALPAHGSGSGTLGVALGSVVAGTSIGWEVALHYEGWTQTVSGAFTAGPVRTLLVDDLETSYLWTAGVPGDTAFTGLWTRGNPVGTSSGGEPVAPEDDATPGAGVLAFITGNGGGTAGTDDVDFGHTTLLSPVLDLSDMGPAVLGWARWYANLTAQDDSFDVSLSGDGGQSWAALDSTGHLGPGWEAVAREVAGVAPQTSAMRLRFVASDETSNSLVEAGVDDLVVRVVDERARCLVWGTPQLGATLSFNVAGDPGSSVTWLVSALPGFLQIPSLAQPLLLDLDTLVPILPGTIPASGLRAVPLAMPVDPVLSGLTLYFQVYVKLGAGKQLTNRQQISFP